MADTVADAVRTVPGVADLHPGAFGEVATYLPGRRVAGIRLGADRAEVHLVVELGVDVHDVAERVRTAVGAVVAHPVDVVVQDVRDPEPQP